jgi:hypothetical protein
MHWDLMDSIVKTLFGVRRAEIIMHVLPYHCLYGTGRCYPSDALIASGARCCTKTIQRFRSTLASLGLIAPVRRKRPTLKESEERGEKPWVSVGGKMIAGLYSTTEWGMSKLVRLLFRLLDKLLAWWDRHCGAISLRVDGCLKLIEDGQMLRVKLGAFWTAIEVT